MINKKDLLDKLFFNNFITDDGRFNPNSRQMFEKNKQLLNEVIDLTSFLSNSCDIKERFHCLLNDITKIPSCEKCGQQVSYNVSKKTYNRFCSLYCARKTYKITNNSKIETIPNSEDIRDEIYKIYCRECNKKMKIISHSHIKNHGLTLQQYKEKYPTAPTKCEMSINIKKESAKRANEFRKGVPRSEEVKEKIKQTKKENPSHGWNKGLTLTDEHKKKMSETRKSMLKNKELIHWNIGGKLKISTKEKISNTLLLKHFTISDESKQKSKETMNEKIKNGWIHPSKREGFSKKSKNTCIERYNRDDFNKIHISEDSLKKLNSKEWMYNEHIIKEKPLYIMAYDLGVNGTTVSRCLRRHELKCQNYYRSIGEKNIEEFLSQFITVESCAKKLIPPYEIDLYIKSKNIAVEFNGLYWHSELYKNENYHAVKYKRCQEKGIRLITIFEDEWLYRQEQVKAKLKSIFGVDDRERIFARKCKIISLNKKQKSSFFEQNHIQGDGPGSISYGLEYKGEIVAAITFINQKNGKYVLNRYATAKRVPGGFSKLLEHFKRNNEWKEIVTFADLRWSEGGLYEKCGFRLDKILKPDYEYVNTAKITREHKFNYRHKNLKNKLKEYNPDLTEKENCEKNRIFKIWDCGKKKYIMNSE